MTKNKNIQNNIIIYQEKFAELQETISFIQNKSTNKNLKGQRD